MTSEQLTELKRLDAAATPPPWKYDTAPRDFLKAHGVEMEPRTVQEITDDLLIVATRNAMPELIAEIERLQGELRKQTELRAAADATADRMETGRCQLREENARLQGELAAAQAACAAWKGASIEVVEDVKTVQHFHAWHVRKLVELIAADFPGQPILDRLAAAEKERDELAGWFRDGNLDRARVEKERDELRAENDRLRAEPARIKAAIMAVPIEKLCRVAYEGIGDGKWREVDRRQANATRKAMLLVRKRLAAECKPAKPQPDSCVPLKGGRWRPQSQEVRLACEKCNREDCDGITIADACRRGWSEIDEVVSQQEESEWWTHLGTCPDCQRIQPAAGSPSVTMSLARCEQLESCEADARRWRQCAAAKDFPACNPYGQWLMHAGGPYYPTPEAAADAAGGAK